MNVMVYEIKRSATKNAEELFDEESSGFYWNDTKFSNLEKADPVFVVDRPNGKVLFSELNKNDIEAELDFENNSTIVKDNDLKFEVEGAREEFDTFVRLNVIEFVKPPENWDWKTLGSSETTYLSGPNSNSSVAENNLARIEQLQELFDSSSKALSILDRAHAELKGIQKQKSPPKKKKGKNLKLSKICDQFVDFLEAKGFFFEEDEVKNFVLSLKTKPFVILAGISGTGKTKLAILFAKFIGQEANIISVKPNWTDNSDLLGYQNLQGEFQKQALTKILIEANQKENKDRPFFVILDEMNLARVEHYFSDFLSKVETRDFNEGEIQSDRLFNESAGDQSELADLRLTENLYIVGTVNMDETTHPFSRKVLDRANSLEFNDVNLGKVGANKQAPETFEVTNEILKAEYLQLADIYEKNRDFFEKIISELKEINQILRRGDFQFGYRVRDELSIYMWYSQKENIFDRDTAFDFQLKQKILPRLQGSTQTIQSILRELHVLTLKDSSDYIEDWAYSADIKDSLYEFEKGKYKYPRSGKKILRMQRRYLEETFTSFWI